MRKVFGVNGQKRQAQAFVGLQLLLALAFIALVAHQAPYLNVATSRKEVGAEFRAWDARFVGMLDLVLEKPVVNLEFESALDTMSVLRNELLPVLITRSSYDNPLGTKQSNDVAAICSGKYTSDARRAHACFIKKTNGGNVGLLWFLPIRTAPRLSIGAAGNIELFEPVGDRSHINAKVGGNCLVAKPLIPIEAAQFFGINVDVCPIIIAATRYAPLRGQLIDVWTAAIELFANRGKGRARGVEYAQSLFGEAVALTRNALQPKLANEPLDDGFAHTVPLAYVAQREILGDIQIVQGVAIYNILEQFFGYCCHSLVCVGSFASGPGRAAYHIGARLADLSGGVASAFAVLIVVTGLNIKRLATVLTVARLANLLGGAGTPQAAILRVLLVLLRGVDFAALHADMSASRLAGDSQTRFRAMTLNVGGRSRFVLKFIMAIFADAGNHRLRSLCVSVQYFDHFEGMELQLVVPNGAAPDVGTAQQAVKGICQDGVQHGHGQRPHNGEDQATYPSDAENMKKVNGFAGNCVECYTNTCHEGTLLVAAPGAFTRCRELLLDSKYSLKYISRPIVLSMSKSLLCAWSAGLTILNQFYICGSNHPVAPNLLGGQLALLDHGLNTRHSHADHSCHFNGSKKLFTHANSLPQLEGGALCH